MSQLPGSHMPHYDIQISAHGALPPDGAQLTAPTGYTFYFFCPQGEILDWATSVTIYDELKANKVADVTAKAKHTVFEGGKYSDYRLWDLGHAGYATGSILAGKDKAVVDLTGVAQAHPTTLSELLANTIVALGADGPGNTFNVFFNACRS